MPSLKLATEEDWPEVLRMSRAFHQFSPYRNYPFDENKVRAIFDKYVSSPENVIVLIGTLEGKPISVLVGSISELYFSPLRVASEVIWWVDEEYRKTGIGFQLHQAFEFWGKKMGVDIIQVVQTEETTPLTKFYTSNGYHLAESIYIKEIK